FRRRRHSVARDRLLLVVLFGGVFFLMALFQRRNVYYLAVFTALTLAEGMARTWIAFRRRPRALAALTVLLLVALPGLPALARAAGFSGAPGHALLDPLARLRALDPPPVASASLPQPAPGALAGVMAPWGGGHMETAIVERPAGADPFAYGWRRQCRLYTAPTADEAYAILRQARCKYLVTSGARD